MELYGLIVAFMLLLIINKTEKKNFSMGKMVSHSVFWTVVLFISALIGTSVATDLASTTLIGNVITLILGAALLTFVIKKELKFQLSKSALYAALYVGISMAVSIGMQNL